MAAQAALIEETIIGLKKALRRENDCGFALHKLPSEMLSFDAYLLFCNATDTGPDEPITQPTNRGNKLRVNAKYVHEGALGFTNPREFYKQVCSFLSPPLPPS